MDRLDYNELEILKEYSNDNRTSVTVLALTKDKKHIVIVTFSFYEDQENKMKRFLDGNKEIHERCINTSAHMEYAEEVYEEIIASLKTLIAS